MEAISLDDPESLTLLISESVSPEADLDSGMRLAEINNPGSLLSDDDRLKCDESIT
jgi:hypothetical protein